MNLPYVDDGTIQRMSSYFEYRVNNRYPNEGDLAKHEIACLWLCLWQRQCFRGKTEEDMTCLMNYLSDGLPLGGYPV